MSGRWNLLFCMSEAIIYCFRFYVIPGIWYKQKQNKNFQIRQKDSINTPIDWLYCIFNLIVIVKIFPLLKTHHNSQVPCLNSICNICNIVTIYDKLFTPSLSGYWEMGPVQLTNSKCTVPHLSTVDHCKWYWTSWPIKSHSYWQITIHTANCAK